MIEEGTEIQEAINAAANDLLDQVDSPVHKEVTVPEEPEWSEPEAEQEVDPRGREVFRGIYESDILPRADFKFKCSCGHEKTIAKDTTGAVQYLIPATGKHSLDIGCENCKTMITLYFTEHTEVKDDAELVEEVKQVNDEQVLQENKTPEQI